MSFSWGLGCLFSEAQRTYSQKYKLALKNVRIDA